jgi:hypothetical protein
MNGLTVHPSTNSGRTVNPHSLSRLKLVAIKTKDFIMNNYENSKKARRVASVIYLLIMAVILGGTFLSNQQKELSKKQSSQPIETPAVFSDIPVQD